MAEMDAVAGRHALARPHEGVPAVRRHRICSVASTCADGVAAPADAAQLRRNDLGVVEDQQVAGIEQRRQVADDPVLERRCPA